MPLLNNLLVIFFFTFCSLFSHLVKGEVIPEEFLSFVQTCLAELVSTGDILASSIGPDFWQSLPKKYTNIREYNKSVVMLLTIVSFYCSIVVIFVL